MTNNLRADNPLRHLPPVHRLLAQPQVQDLLQRLPPGLVTAAARTVLDAARAAIIAADGKPDTFSGVNPLFEETLTQQVVEEAVRRAAPTLQRAINATGIVLHTGLGRARLAPAAVEALNEVARGHSMLEIDRETGKRGSRRDHARRLLCELTGAQDAAIVNNCAGAVFLAINALAQGREVIISRGELVEIGGAFRMPDIIRAGGATLVEVGTTNRTRLSDYAQAITGQTGLILRCHPSNFALIGFVEETATADMAQLGRERGIPVVDDQGSGALIAVAGQKNTLQESIAAGADLITASADKLLGGPQAGLILGRTDLIDRIVRHPLARALRCDKLTLAALEATLLLYRDPKRAMSEIPTLRYLSRTEPELRRMATRLRTRLRIRLPAERFQVDLIRESSQVGGGSLPGERLPTVCVALRSKAGFPSAEEIMAQLRRNRPAIFARIRDEMILLDPRTLETEEMREIEEALLSLSGSLHRETESRLVR